MTKVSWPQTKPCEFCGKDVTKTYKESVGRKFWTCDATCSNKLRVKLGFTPNWEPNPFRGQQETRACAICQTPVTRYLKPANVSQEWTCSRKCKATRQAQISMAAGTWKKPVNTRKGETTPCVQCGKPVYRSKSTRANGEGKFCSRACSDAFQSRNKATLVCEQCNKPFQVAASQAAYGRKFCSRSCETKSRLKHGTGREHNGRPVRRNEGGYILIYEPTHPSAMHNGYVLEHRFLVEQAIGRLLDKREHVHHKNGNRQDNRLENLEVLGLVEHIKLTNRETNERRDRIKTERDALKAKVAELEKQLREMK